MKAILATTALLLFCLAALPARAITDAAPMKDPKLEARYQTLTHELRCLVCQNETIADSTADLAGDLRGKVREMLKQGKTNQQIIDYMTQRYGDFVLYKPPVRPDTWLLWFGPFILLLVGGTVLALTLRRRGQMAEDELDSDDPGTGMPPDKES
ncbi:MAG: cytochrome c-type biogenesis protein CcmH [Gammaproteobacteria bacterium]